MSPERSPLSTVFEEYEKIANKSIEDSIKSETHGSLEEAMLTVGKRWSSVFRLRHAHCRALGEAVAWEAIASTWVPVLAFKRP